MLQQGLVPTRLAIARQKIKVLRCASTTAATSSSNWSPMCPAHGNRANAWGMVLVMRISLVMSDRTKVPSQCPTRPPTLLGLGQRRTDAPDRHASLAASRNAESKKPPTPPAPHASTPTAHATRPRPPSPLTPAFGRRLWAMRMERLGGCDQDIRQGRSLLGFLWPKCHPSSCPPQSNPKPLAIPSRHPRCRQTTPSMEQPK